MRWLRDYLAKRRRTRRITTAARQFFHQQFPNGKVVWSVVAEDGPDSCVVGITYDAQCIPPPYRFFRVALPGLSVSYMATGYWPAGWGLYR